jgi:hypothetical protein
MALVVHDAYVATALIFLLGAFTINSNDPRIEAVGWIAQAAIACGVAWAIKKINQVQVLTNSRADRQDKKIADLEARLGISGDQLSTARETLASERATAVTSQAVVDVAAATEPTKGN